MDRHGKSLVWLGAVMLALLTACGAPIAEAEIPSTTTPASDGAPLQAEAAATEVTSTSPLPTPTDVTSSTIYTSTTTATTTSTSLPVAPTTTTRTVPPTSTTTTVPLTSGLVTGTVTDAVTGKPLGGASVDLLTPDGILWVNEADASGYFVFDPVELGTGNLGIHFLTYESQSVSVEISGATTVVDIALVPLPFGSVTGTVTDSVTGLPLEGVYVDLFSPDGLPWIDVTNASGAYSFIGVELGTGTLYTDIAGYVPQTVAVTIVEGETIVSFALVPVP